MSLKKSIEALTKARSLFPGGVNSPVRSFNSVGGDPVVFKKGRGAVLTDLDGNEYLDMVQSWGAHILGHSSPKVVEAVRKQARRLTSVGAPTAEENKLGRLIQTAFPSLELMRFVSSGTEAVMSALRVARGATGRNKILKFDGGYHGHSDALLVSAGSGLATLSAGSSVQTSSAGVTPETAAGTLSVPYNDLAAVEAAFKANPGQIAAVLLEPVAANMGLVLPGAGFLQGLRKLCDAQGALLIFDEVITGFRVGPSGAQGLYNVRPDLTTLGKIIGGGLPVGAYGGRKDLMELVAPLGPVYQAGTLSGNPLAMAAGAAVLKKLARPGFYTELDEKAEEFFQALVPALDPAKHTLNRLGGVFTLFFAKGPITDYASAKRSDTAAYARFFHALLGKGVYFPPAQFEAAFVGVAHGGKQLRRVARVIGEALG